MSPRYTAPEVFTRNLIGANVDIEEEKRADVYSFSIIIWELLTRKKPWDELSVEEIELNVRQGKRPHLEDFKGNQITSVLVAMTELCWKQLPSERPSFKEIKVKLDSIVY